MIQRVQTVHLLISIILLSSLFWLPLAEISVGEVLYTLSIKGISGSEGVVFQGLPLLLFLTLLILLHLIVIFLYRKRILQIRLLVFTIVAMLGFSGILVWFAYAGFKGATVGFKIPIAIPWVAIILDYLAIRNIGKDEALIRSIDRLRK